MSVDEVAAALACRKGLSRTNLLRSCRCSGCQQVLPRRRVPAGHGTPYRRSCISDRYVNRNGVFLGQDTIVCHMRLRQADLSGRIPEGHLTACVVTLLSNPVSSVPATLGYDMIRKGAFAAASPIPININGHMETNLCQRSPFWKH